MAEILHLNLGDTSSDRAWRSAECGYDAPLQTSGDGQRGNHFTHTDGVRHDGTRNTHRQRSKPDALRLQGTGNTYIMRRKMA